MWGVPINIRPVPLSVAEAAASCVSCNYLPPPPPGALVCNAAGPGLEFIDCTTEVPTGYTSAPGRAATRVEQLY